LSPAPSLSSLFLLCCFFFECYGHHLSLHSFPTRRSSDLILIRFRNIAYSIGSVAALACDTIIILGAYSICWGWMPFSLEIDQTRSEEHTSELQSRFDLVCRLLLEKKKETNIRSNS